MTDEHVELDAEAIHRFNDAVTHQWGRLNVRITEVRRDRCTVEDLGGERRVVSSLTSITVVGYANVVSKMFNAWRQAAGIKPNQVTTGEGTKTWEGIRAGFAYLFSRHTMHAYKLTDLTDDQYAAVLKCERLVW